MKLVNEDEYGAYLGVTQAFLKEFIQKESNPNFEIFDSRDGQRRFIAVKSSRLPDDEDLSQGKYGIDFHRSKPDYSEAKQYKSGLPDALQTTQKINNIAFAATSKEEYDRKSTTWENFYSYIWEQKPQVIWVTPHSGSVSRLPDNILPFPKWETDNFASEVSAKCSFEKKEKTSSRIMFSIHSHNWYGAILDLGGFGVIDQQKLSEVVIKIELKYHQKIQNLAVGCKKDFYHRATRWLEHIKNKNKSLNPRDIRDIAFIDSTVLNNIIKALKIYNIEINEYAFEEYKEAILSLNKKEIKAVSNGQIFPALNVGKNLKLTEKINQGLINSALQIECLKWYAAKAPELVSDIILDVKNALIGE